MFVEWAEKGRINLHQAREVQPELVQRAVQPELLRRDVRPPIFNSIAKVQEAAMRRRLN